MKVVVSRSRSLQGQIFDCIIAAGGGIKVSCSCSLAHVLVSLLLTRESDEAGEVLLTKEEQEHKPLLSSSSKSSDSSRHASKATKAGSALLLKENLVQMRKQPRDAVREHLLKV